MHVVTNLCRVVTLGDVHDVGIACETKHPVQTPSTTTPLEALPENKHASKAICASERHRAESEPTITVHVYSNDVSKRGRTRSDRHVHLHIKTHLVHSDYDEYEALWSRIAGVCTTWKNDGVDSPLFRIHRIAKSAAVVVLVHTVAMRITEGHWEK